ncbi:PepSY domain-containing protein [Acetobacter sp. LMG 1636]|uniref:PepSY domain-containing protein n=2 Tax=Acetobacter fallax TaxID=1737473 RepID=A0ABX0K6I1_9PROT|nr:PepSY domain-containing protein [Acetobacter fallax]NHO35000.1 PepSY domain-containing protein [Acetobacter fallax]
MTWLHDWSGIITGWLIFAIALSGTLSVFRPEITVWMHPELTRETADPIPAAEAAITWLSTHAPHSPDWYLDVPTPRAPFTLALWSDKNGYVFRPLDPLTGSPDALRDTHGGEFFYRFHFELQLPYPWGRLLAAIAAMALVLTLLTGIVAHRRFFADFFTFRPGKGQRSWLDAHNLLGVIALPFHLMIAFTGAVTLSTLLLPWGAQTLYKSDLTTAQHELHPAAIERPVTGKATPLAPIGPILRTAEQHFGKTGILSFYIENPGDQAAVITVTAGNTDSIGITSHVISFDGTTGTILAEHTEHRPVITTFNVLYGLHVARFAPGITRWLYFLSGLMLTALTGTGLRLWTISRTRNTPRLSTTLVDRLNVGFIAGTPTAFASYFLANRLLPVSLADRATLEIRTVFLTWAALLLFAALRPATKTWPELLSLAAITCAAVALISAPWHRSVDATTALTAFIFAAAFAAAARRAALKKRHPTT